MGGHLPVVKYLIEEQSVVLACLGQRGSTPLHRAAYYNHFELINYLLAKQQVDSQCQDEDGYTPLHRASQGGDIDVVTYLVKDMSKHTHSRLWFLAELKMDTLHYTLQHLMVTCQ